VGASTRLCSPRGWVFRDYILEYAASPRNKPTVSGDEKGQNCIHQDSKTGSRTHFDGPPLNKPTVSFTDATVAANGGRTIRRKCVVWKVYLHKTAATTERDCTRTVTNLESVSCAIRRGGAFTLFMRTGDELFRIEQRNLKDGHPKAHEALKEELEHHTEPYPWREQCQQRLAISSL
jgi:hypothetical protein